VKQIIFISQTIRWSIYFLRLAIMRSLPSTQIAYWSSNQAMGIELVGKMNNRLNLLILPVTPTDFFLMYEEPMGRMTRAYHYSC
jgi:hypothetical protein